VSSRTFLFIDDPLDDLDVHGVVADFCHFGGNVRPVDESRTIAGEARASRQPLRVVICRRWIPCEEKSRTFFTKSRHRPSSVEPP